MTALVPLQGCHEPFGGDLAGHAVDIGLEAGGVGLGLGGSGGVAGAFTLDRGGEGAVEGLRFLRQDPLHQSHSLRIVTS